MSPYVSYLRLKRNPLKKYALICLALLCTFSTAVTASEPNDKLESLFEQHQDRVIYLDFWASWCIPCRKSFGWMNEMLAKYKDKGLVIISVNVDTDPKLAAAFLKKNPINFPVIYDHAGVLASQYGLKGMPSSYLYARDGKLKATHVGFLTKHKPRYEAQINALLAQQQATD